MEREQGSGGFEKQYRQLLEQIQSIYENAKEFHSKVYKNWVWILTLCAMLCRLKLLNLSVNFYNFSLNVLRESKC